MACSIGECALQPPRKLSAHLRYGQEISDKEDSSRNQSQGLRGKLIEGSPCNKCIRAYPTG